MEYGIPGHASTIDGVKRLQLLLKEYGVSYDAENEMTRIHLYGLIIEVYPEGHYVKMTISVPLPTENDSVEYIDYFLKSYETALKIILSIKGKPEYQLDTSLPSNPTLYIVVKYNGIEDVIMDIQGFLGKYKKII